MSLNIVGFGCRKEATPLQVFDLKLSVFICQIEMQSMLAAAQRAWQPRNEARARLKEKAEQTQKAEKLEQEL